MSAMNPEEIRKLPMRRDLPYNGLTREQVLAIGADPDEVEAGRQSLNQWAEQQARHDEAQLFLAAQEAVANGELTYVEAAEALHAGGFQGAHALLVQQWQQDDAEFAALDAADELAVMDSAQYVEHFAAQQQRGLAASEADVQNIQRQLAQAQVTELQADLKSFVESTPGAHQHAPQVEQRLVENIQKTGVIPSTPEERAAAIESALKETAVLDSTMQSLRQQVDTEWRAIRRQEGARSDLLTQADIDRARDAYIEGRMKQLADSTLIDLDSLKPGPTAEEQSAALAEKYRERQSKSTELHQTVAGIAERGRDANATRDRGEGNAEERKAYKEAMARAEAEAQFGNAEIKSGYGANAVQETPKDSRLPEGWVDEFGPGGYS